MRHLVLTLASLALLASGCTKQDPAAGAASSAASAPKVLRLGNGTEPQELDPQTVAGVPEHRIISALLEGLVMEDPRDLHPIPGQAERWEISPDGLTYTFHLRPNLQWSDGEPLTADDFVQSYRRMLTPSLGSEYSYLLWFVKGAEEYNQGKLTDFRQVGFKAPDARTLVVELKSPTPFLLQIIASHYAWTPVPVKVIARHGPVDQRRNPWTRPGNNVGNGPFRLKEWTPNQKIVVERNPHYWDAAAVKLDRIEFLAIDDIAAEERMFRTGQIHKTNELPLAKIDTYRREHPEVLRIEPYLGVSYYYFNVQRPPFTDKRVRRALALAIDRESLVKNVLRGGQQPAYAVTYPGIAGYQARARLEGGVEEARRLLAEAGYPGGRGFPEVELLYNSSDNVRILAEAMQQMWRTHLGIEIRLVNQEWKVYRDSLRTHNFTLGRAGWIADYVDPHVFLEIWVTNNGNNDGQFSHPEYDRLFQQALVARTTEERYEIYQQMDAILVEECPLVPIYYYTRVYALSPKVLGWHPTLLDNHPYKFLDLAE
ncbi:MAG: peptide ABC transporter substrate-binding protein [Opitutaceae bacterium]|nr:peptide ABC transporter substrate-binding protein [Opitutaceae bacterium]